MSIARVARRPVRAPQESESPRAREYPSPQCYRRRNCLRGFAQGDGLGAVRTALGVDWNLAQALRTLLRGRIGRRWRFAHSRDQEIHWGHDKEIHGRRYQHKRDAGIDEVADGKHAAVDGELDGGEIRFSNNRRNQRSQQILGESRYHRGERRPDDDADRHVDYVAAKNELLESAKHGPALLWTWRPLYGQSPPPSRPVENGRSGPSNETILVVLGINSALGINSETTHARARRHPHIRIGITI